MRRAGGGPNLNPLASHSRTGPPAARRLTHTKVMEKVTRSFKNLYRGSTIPNQLEIHSTVIALSDES